MHNAGQYLFENIFIDTQELGARNANVESRSENCQGESVLYVNRGTHDLCSYSNNHASMLIGSSARYAEYKKELLK